MIFLKIVFSSIVICRNWVVAILNRVMAKYFEITVPIKSIDLRNGIRFEVADNLIGSADLFILREIWHKHYYTREPTLAIQKEDVVVDIGANKGYFSIYAGMQASEGKVFSFEPEPHNFKMLQRNIRANHFDNVQAFQLAIAGRPGTTDLSLCKGNDGGHSVVRTDASSTIAVDTVTVSTDTLESFCDLQNVPRINFMKVDCEGAEYDIFANMSKEMFSRIDRISMEYHDIAGHSHAELSTLFQANGFAVQERKDYLFAVRDGGVGAAANPINQLA